MSLFLQQPWLTPLLALAALPLLVHLLSRTRPPVYRFSNLEFLQRVIRRTARFRKPKDWLLLVLRTLAITALAATFLGPLLVARHGALPGEKRSVILLVDRSASMAARSGAATRFEAAVLAARETLDTLRPDSANIIWIDEEPTAVFPEPAPNLSFLKESLGLASAKQESGALARAWEMALRQITSSSGRKELVVISDFQTSAWKNFELTAPENIQVRTIPIHSDDTTNLAVTSLVVTPPEPVAGQDASVLCRVRNFSPEARRSTLTLDASGSHQSKTLELQPWSETEASFTIRCPIAGLLSLTASLESDGFPGDDRRFAAVRVRESLRMAVAGVTDAPEAKIARALADALPWLDAIDCPDPSNPPPCDLLLIPGWKGGNADQLRALADRGTTVFVFPLSTCPVEGLITLTGSKVDGVAASMANESNPEGWKATPSEGVEAFALFASGEFGNPLAGTTRQRIRIPEAVAAKTTVLGVFSDGRPALLSLPTSSAPILVCALALDPKEGDWTQQPTFLPAFAELILHTRTKQSKDHFEVVPGSIPSWSPTDPAQAATLTLQHPTGSLLTLERITDAHGTLWKSTQPTTPGIYSWLISGQPVHLTVANFPEAESDLRCLPEPPAIQAAGVKRSTLARATTIDQGLPLWPLLAACALLILLIEPLIASAPVTKSS